MKILPSNQTLILAGESAGPRGNRAASGAALQRVTILTARRDTTVVVQADYFSHDDASPPGAGLPEVSAPGLEFGAPANDATSGDTTNAPSTVNTAITANAATPRADSRISSYLKPIELYTRTQRGLKDASMPALLDVLA